MAKFFSLFFLLVLRLVLRALLYLYFWLTGITLVIQTVTAAQHECQDTEHLQVKQKTGRIHPAFGKILFGAIVYFV